MYRRPYFLFPDQEKTRRAVADLVEAGVAERHERHMHAVAKDGIPLAGLPVATARQRRDVGDPVGEEG